MPLKQEDERWAAMRDAYGVYDPRDVLRRLALGDPAAWDEIWGTLHAQGRIGEASYAALPQIVRLHRRRTVPDRNVYAFATMIEDARHNEANPPLPDCFARNARMHG